MDEMRKIEEFLHYGADLIGAAGVVLACGTPPRHEEIEAVFVKEIGIAVVDESEVMTDGKLVLGLGAARKATYEDWAIGNSLPYSLRGWMMGLYALHLIREKGFLVERFKEFIIRFNETLKISTETKEGLIDLLAKPDVLKILTNKTNKPFLERWLPKIEWTKDVQFVEKVRAVLEERG